MMGVTALLIEVLGLPVCFQAVLEAKHGYIDLDRTPRSHEAVIPSSDWEHVINREWPTLFAAKVFYIVNMGRLSVNVCSE